MSFIFQEMLSISVAKTASVGTVPERNFSVYIFSTYVWSSGVHPGQNIEVVSALVPERIFFFKNSYLLQMPKKPPNGRFRNEILGFIFFSTHDWFSGVNPGQNIEVVSALVPDGIFFFKKSYLFQLLQNPPYERSRSGILRFIFSSTHVWSSVNITVV